MERYPKGCKLLQLKKGLKEPVGGHGHKDAVPLSRFLDVTGNVGIQLDSGPYLLVDIDRECRESSELREKLVEYVTWGQEAPHGRHWLFRVDEKLAREIGNTKLGLDCSSGVWGDLKVHGYCVAPGSHVECDGTRHVVLDLPLRPTACKKLQALATKSRRIIHSPKSITRTVRCSRTEYRWNGVQDCLQAPEWLIDVWKATKRYKEACRAAERPKTGGFLPAAQGGGHHDALVALGLWGHRQGLNAEANARLLAAVKKAGLLIGETQSWPFKEQDFVNIANSFEGYAVERKTVEAVPRGWRTALDTPKVGPILRWWIKGFVPQGKLVMLYGSKGRGKTTFAKWLAQKVTSKQKPVLYLGVEETPQTFYAGARLAGADDYWMFDLESPTKWRFPRDCGLVLEGMRELGPSGLFYIDAIKSHYEYAEGMLTNERDRQVLGALAKLAEDSGWTILCTFHDNKLGEYAGSTEMVNVARVVMKATRYGTGPLRIGVKYSNFTMPGYRLQFDVEHREIHDEETGEYQLEEDENGIITHALIGVPRELGVITEEEAEKDKGESNFGKDGEAHT